MKRILLVEDNDMNQDMLSRFLVLFGFDVVVAADGFDGMAMAESSAPDLILMDMSLPLLDGWEVTRRLKSAVKTRSIPIVGLTAHAMTGDKEKALQAGCDDYETKPIDFTRLLKKIDGFLQTNASSLNPDLNHPAV